MTAKEKVSRLREEMQRQQIDAFIVYSADPHMSEYLPEIWQERVWLSGFTGSAGLVVITKEKAGLWTDGRYFTQAELQLNGSGIDLFKDGIVGTPNYIDWIVSQIPENGKVAVNALTTSHANWTAVEKELLDNNRKLVHAPLLNNIWTNREGKLTHPIFVQPLSRAGKSAEDKIADIRAEMKQSGATFHIISMLDDIAWTLNLRGSDIECNPVFLSYCILTEHEIHLFVDKHRLEKEAVEMLGKQSISVHAYEEYFEFLKTVKNEKILVASNANQMTFDALKDNNELIVNDAPAHLMKALKNETELKGFHSAMEKDGVAMVKFLYWLTQNVGKEPMDEYSIGEKLLGFRQEQKDFVGVSFDSIVGYNGNGSIIHYKAPKEGCAKVTNSGSILIDSGGQFLEGTTDITRTLPLGDVSEEFKHDYTLVLKAHIDLAMIKFPRGTRGVQLDVLARQPLWNEGKDFNHGTGHGVGCFMNVHEGPQSIRKDYNPQVLLPGMVISNEPGYYLVGKYGIRHENLLAVRSWKTTEWNEFYEFETITYCPFFKEAIVKELLSDEEIKWFNNYHQLVKEKLESHLEGAVKDWFLKMVEPL